RKYNMSKIRNIIFDFGGVILDLDRENAVRKFKSIGVNKADEYLDKYHQKGIFLQCENGEIGEMEFVEKLRALCNKDLTYQQVYDGWNAFIVNTEKYKLDYILSLRQRGYKVFLLSNTNPFVMKWARSKEFTEEGLSIDHYVDRAYISYEIKSVKPDRKIFEYLISDSGILPEESLFVDDGEQNIEAGNKIGFKTLLTKNREDWRDKIEKLLEND
ncbi:HAD family hydrolase, partial [Phocaeicola paurosaccharolyticus]|uniref:HAD family hydrolase n=1 Tax=Phocaeicola paurosaccharolyticus TaxID=732242 RepID=UPI0034E2C44D